MPCFILVWVLHFWAEFYRIHIQHKSHPEAVSSCWFWLPLILNCTVMALISARPVDLTLDSWYRGSSYVIKCGLTVSCVRFFGYITFKVSLFSAKAPFFCLFPNSVFFTWSFWMVDGHVLFGFLQRMIVHQTWIRVTLGNIAHDYLY